MTHLPEANGEEYEGLHEGPPEYARVGALTGHPEPFFPHLLARIKGKFTFCTPENES